jgi:hypothetical protein
MTEQSPQQGRSQDEGGRSLFSALPAFPVEGAEAAGATALVCNECEQPNRGTASYSVLHIVFLLFALAWRIDTVFKCPRCMRAYLLRRLPLALLLATIFAPMILVWWGVLFVRTLGR